MTHGNFDLTNSYFTYTNYKIKMCFPKFHSDWVNIADFISLDIKLDTYVATEVVLVLIIETFSGLSNIQRFIAGCPTEVLELFVADGIYVFMVDECGRRTFCIAMNFFFGLLSGCEGRVYALGPTSTLWSMTDAEIRNLFRADFHHDIYIVDVYFNRYVHQFLWFWHLQISQMAPVRASFWWKSVK